MNRLRSSSWSSPCRRFDRRSVSGSAIHRRPRAPSSCNTRRFELARQRRRCQVGLDVGVVGADLLGALGVVPQIGREISCSSSTSRFRDSSTSGIGRLVETAGDVAQIVGEVTHRSSPSRPIRLRRGRSCILARPTRARRVAWCLVEGVLHHCDRLRRLRRRRLRLRGRSPSAPPGRGHDRNRSRRSVALDDVCMLSSSAHRAWELPLHHWTSSRSARSLGDPLHHRPEHLEAFTLPFGQWAF